MKDEKFCIRNQKGSGCVGNCAIFWGPDGCGYTVNLDEAWKVSYEEAVEICRSRPDEDFPVSYDTLLALSHRHVDIQAIRRAMERGEWT
jgi:hypothetical protein